jgi:alanine dehydrogenase
MRIGVPTEIKPNEKRVGLVPESVEELTRRGHEIYIQAGAGEGIAMNDAAYEAAGATILPDADAVFDTAELIVKVKEPQPVETAKLREDQTLFTYLHLAPDPEQAEGLIESGCTAIAYETITAPGGGLPLLAPMSEVAGRLAAQAAAHQLESGPGGPGILMGGVPGVPPARVTIIGAGVSGANALRVAVGLGAEVTVLDKDKKKLQAIDNEYQGRVRTVYSTATTLEAAAVESDAVIGCVLVPGAAAPKLITRALLKKMKPGSVFVDVSIDQGGCAETSRPTTHAEPTFVEEGVIHYCVANMPGGVAQTSAMALNHATLPFVIALAEKGPKQALLDDPHFLEGLNVHQGMITYGPVAEALGKTYVPAAKALDTRKAA